MRLLVTGAAGFIGSSFVHLLARETDYEVTALDALTYAGSLDNLAGLARPVRFIQGDVSDPQAVRTAMAVADCVVHLAAESHVDRSIASPVKFVRTNAVGTQVLLDAAHAASVSRFLYVSTDEVYGSLGADGRFTEQSPLAPSSPYAASKAAGEMLVQASRRTYGLPTLVTRCGNNFGPRQVPEKLVPLVILRALRGQPVPVYGRGTNVRDWIYVEDHCRALLQVLRRGRPGEVYNVGAGEERSNLGMVTAILDVLGAPHDLIRHVPDRPGHDFRYALDTGKLGRELGWAPKWPFREGLEATVRWYADHRGWVDGMARRLAMAGPRTSG